MHMPNDFFAERLASIEHEKVRRLAPIEEQKPSHAHVNRLSRAIPLVVDCIREMRAAELREIVDLLRAAADALDK
jgi:hypothetical protein